MGGAPLSSAPSAFALTSNDVIDHVVGECGTSMRRGDGREADDLEVLRSKLGYEVSAIEAALL